MYIGRGDDATRGQIGLDDDDMGISRCALELRATDEGLVITNMSSKKPLYVDTAQAGHLRSLRPGERHLVTDTTGVEVRGLIRTHRIDLVPATPVEAHLLETLPGEATVVDRIEYSEADLDALTAIYKGYLEQFPRRDCRPLTYAEAGELLDLPASTVRRRVEHIRERLRRIDVFIEGPQAREQLATHLLDHGVIGPEDLARLEHR